MAVLDIDRIRLNDSTVVLDVKGYLDAFSVTEFRQAAAEHKTVRKLIINLSTSFLDSAGLNALVGAVRQVRERGGEAALVCAHPRMTRVLNTSGLDRIMAVRSTMDEARAALEALPSTRRGSAEATSAA
jgi:anti-sigma B factor antagonist